MELGKTYKLGALASAKKAAATEKRKAVEKAVKEAVEKEREQSDVEKVKDVLQQYQGTSVEVRDTELMKLVTNILKINGQRKCDEVAYKFIRENFENVTVMNGKFVVPTDL